MPKPCVYRDPAPDEQSGIPQGRPPDELQWTVDFGVGDNALRRGLKNCFVWQQETIQKQLDAQHAQLRQALEAMLDCIRNDFAISDSLDCPGSPQGASAASLQSTNGFSFLRAGDITASRRSDNYAASRTVSLLTNGSHLPPSSEADETDAATRSIANKSVQNGHSGHLNGHAKGAGAATIGSRHGSGAIGCGANVLLEVPAPDIRELSPQDIDMGPPGSAPQSFAAATLDPHSHLVTQPLRTTSTQLSKDRDTPFKLKLRDFVDSNNFDVMVSALVCLNVILMFVQLEYLGHEAAYQIGIREQMDSWRGATKTFWICENFFNVCFVLELLLRTYAVGRQYFKSVANVFDVFVVCTTCVDAWILTPFVPQGKAVNANFARVARLAKLMKALRAFRVAALFSELRVLITTLAASVMALSWSAVLLGLIIIASGILMAQLCVDLVTDDQYPYEMRAWIYNYYGTAARACYTMFEATLSGCWPNYARPLIDGVSPWFGCFWVLYALAVVFAVVRIISALFLSNTMKISAEDEEMMVSSKWKEKQRYLGKLCRFFKEADLDGNGMLDREEFDLMVSNPSIASWLTILGLEMHEVASLFNVLDDGDGLISYQEFVGGCMRLKGNARAIDSVLIMHEQFKILQCLDEMHDEILQVQSSIKGQNLPRARSRKFASSRNHLLSDIGADAAIAPPPVTSDASITKPLANAGEILRKGTEKITNQLTHSITNNPAAESLQKLRKSASGTTMVPS
eukprot:TRINITY_DN17219_c0_g1_i1.p1 TRINITY_DN17219_c0_g1~~TRINITY_DN17219_c0_g1_i1.p1  ORF type:complete len:744 (+),score=147.40 TRINITY_DN17219_c0_g1_i1:92-2323(+)